MLVTPTHAGGIKLAAVSVTSKTQRTKHVVAWLTQKPGQYFAAWRAWAFRGSLGPDATLVPPLQHRIHSPGQELKQELGERLAPTTDQQSKLTAWISTHSTALLDRVAS